MKLAIILSLSIATLGLALGSIWYVPSRVSRLLELKRTRWLYVSAAVSLLLLPAALGLNKVVTSSVVEILATGASVLLGWYLYLTPSLLVFDLLRLVTSLPDRVAVWSAVAAASLLAGVGAWRGSTFDVTRTEIAIKGLEKSVTLVHMSDVHIGAQRGRAWLERIVRVTNRLKPQLVLINGDLVDARNALQPGVLAPLARFKAPVYYTLGNHESYVGRDLVLKVLAGHGVRILRNQVVQTHGLQLLGLDHMNADEHAFDMHSTSRLTMKATLPRIALKPGRPVVLMHHAPVGAKYAARRGVALMLAGHTHGGQIFPGTLFGRLFFPLNRGLYTRGRTKVFVSQGVGTVGPRLRLGSSNEINLIRLIPKK